MDKQKEITLYIYNLRKFLIKHKVFETYKDMEYFFTMGGCYIFARILQRKFDLPIALTYNGNHCGIYLRTSFFKKVFFDIFGPDTNSFLGFKKCSQRDIKYIEENFGFLYYPDKDFEEKFIEKILEAFEKNQKPSFGSISFSYQFCKDKYDTINIKGSI